MPHMRNIVAQMLASIVLENCYCYKVYNYSSQNLASVPREMIASQHENDVVLNRSALLALDLSANEIAGIRLLDFRGLNRVVDLNMSHNRLVEIAPASFRDMNQLQVLALSDNQLSTIHVNTFSRANSLKTLLLADNQIKVIKAGAFMSQDILQLLNLTNNHLQSADKNVYQNLKQIETILLRHNQIMTIESNTFNLQFLKLLDLSENPIQCNSLGNVPGNTTVALPDGPCITTLRPTRITTPTKKKLKVTVTMDTKDPSTEKPADMKRTLISVGVASFLYIFGVCWMVLYTRKRLKQKKEEQASLMKDPPTSTRRSSKRRVSSKGRKTGRLTKRKSSSKQKRRSTRQTKSTNNRELKAVFRSNSKPQIFRSAT